MYDAANAIAGALFLTSARVLLTTCIASSVYAILDAFDPDTVGSDPSIQAGSGLRCGRYRGPPCSQLPWKHHLRLRNDLLPYIQYDSLVEGEGQLMPRTRTLEPQHVGIGAMIDALATRLA